MSPDFTIAIAGSNPTAVLKQRMLSLRVRTTTGRDADQVEMTLDDRDNLIALPAKGAVITVSIGFVGVPLVNAGRYTVDEIEIDGGAGDTIKISGKSADMRGGLKTTKNRSFHAMTLGAVVAQVAADNGLTPQVHPSLASIVIDHRDQSGESDLHFCTRLADDHGAIVAPKGGKLIMVPRGAGLSASGAVLTSSTLTRADLKKWTKGGVDRSRFGTVRARHRNLASGTEDYQTAGSGDPTHTLRHPYPSPAAAGHAATAHLRALQQKSNTLSLDMAVGRPDLWAGVPITVSGVRAGVDGPWVCKDVEHDIDWGKKAFDTRIKATVTGKDEDDGGDGGGE